MIELKKIALKYRGTECWHLYENPDDLLIAVCGGVDWSYDENEGDEVPSHYWQVERRHGLHRMPLLESEKEFESADALLESLGYAIRPYRDVSLPLQSSAEGKDILD